MTVLEIIEMPESQQKPLSDKDKEFLLKEYELCQNAAQNLESIIWQTSAVIGIGSIGSLILVANQYQQASLSWQAASLIGLLVFLFSCIWLFMARRWWSIQHIKYLRMSHIEEKLRLYQTRYLNYVDGLQQEENREEEEKEIKANNDLSDDQKEEIRDRAVKDKEYVLVFFLMKHHQHYGIRDIIKYIPVIIFFVWGLFLLWGLYTP